MRKSSRGSNVCSQEMEAESTRSSRSDSEDEDIEERGDSGRDADVSSSESSQPTSVSLLQVLKAPMRSELSRKRRVAQNLTHDGRCNEMSTI